MPFEFIDNNVRIDRNTRKRIRSLVATGKNAGKTVVRPSRIKAFKEQSKNPTAFSSVPGTVELRRPDFSSSSPDDTASSPGIERPIGDDLFFTFTSNQLNPASRYLAKRGAKTTLIIRIFFCLIVNFVSYFFFGGSAPCIRAE